MNISPYNEYRKTTDVHGIALYPAVMVAPVLRDIIRRIISEDTIHTVFDPFQGSGTALYETKMVDKNIHVVGFDINPLANLISLIKLNGVDTGKINEDWITVRDYIQNPRIIETFEFPRSEKWFQPEIKSSIAIVRSAIMKVECKQNRQFFWGVLCDVIRKYSNTRSSTYKLHMKTKEEISRLKNRVNISFMKKVINEIPKFTTNYSPFDLRTTDTLKELLLIGDRDFDLSITSPPYGDNLTTVPYGQFSMLSLYTIPRDDLEINGWELNNYSIIDSNSLGGKLVKRKCYFSDFENSLILPYLKLISERKKEKVNNFFIDYFIFLKQLCRVTNKYIVLTLGNRTVDGVRINLTQITKSFVIRHGFIFKEEFHRAIPKKRIPQRISSVNKSPVASMTEEITLIFQNSK